MTSSIRKTIRAAIAAALSAAVMAHPALAEDTAQTPATDILGTWSFKTKPYRDGACIMTGSMFLSPSEEADTYGCELTAVETCAMWGRSVVRQSCSVRRFGEQLSIRSQIEEMLESKGNTAGLTYMPDNFTLSIQSPKRMYGALVSAVTAPAEFTRSDDGIS